MTKLYSPSARGFYDTDSPVKIPADAKPITDEQHAALLLDNSRGKVIDHDSSGEPLARDLNDDELAIGRKSARDQMLAETDWLVARHRDETEAAGSTTLAADAYKVLQKWRADLRNLTKDPDFPRVQFPPRPAGI